MNHKSNSLINTLIHTHSPSVVASGFGPPFRRSATPKVLSADANRLVKPFPRIPRVRVRVRVRLDQPAIQVSSQSFGMADLRNGGPKPLPAKCDAQLIGRLRSAKLYPTCHARTARFLKSFIPYSLANFQ